MIEFINLSHVTLQTLRNKYISAGYRFVTYRPDGYVHAMMFDKAGDPFNFKYKFPSRVGYAVNDEGEMYDKDIFGRSIKYKSFNNASKKYKWMEQNADNLTLVDTLAPAQDFLNQLFNKETEDDNFNKQSLRTHFIDIETEVSDDGFEYPFTARNRINLITVYDTADEIYRTWSLHRIDHSKVDQSIMPQNDKCVVYDDFNDDEQDMLLDYLSWHSKNYPDVITGWNTNGFDIPYMMRRFENVFSNSKYPKSFSPLGQYTIKEVGEPENPNNPNSQRIEVRVNGIAQLDELLLYRDKFIVKGALGGGYNLSNVAQVELGSDKIQFDGSFKEFYTDNWDLFYAYNVRDVSLVVDLEKKLRLIDLARQIIGYGLVPDYERCYGAISYSVGSVYNFTKKHKGLIFPTYSRHADADVVTKFEGAYVFDTVPGFYDKGIAVADAASLYPSVIRATNISPETYVGRLDSKSLNAKAPEDEVVIHLPSGGIQKITKAGLDKLVEERCILTKNDTLFIKPSIKSGILAEWCAHYFALRNVAKQGEIVARNKGDEATAALLHVKNTGLKLLLNSLYGIMGSKYCPFFSTDLAQTVTRQGRFCNMSIDKYLRSELTRIFNIAPNYKILPGGDTDSVFINIQCITDKFKEKFYLPVKIKEWSDEYKLKLWEYVYHFITEKVTPHIQNQLITQCGCEDVSMLVYDLEYISDVTIFQAKKNYGTHIILKEGPVIVDAVKYVGLEMKKATLPEAIKSVLEDVYSNTFAQNWDEADFHAYINDTYHKFITLPVGDIAQWKGYGTAKTTTGFLSLEKGATAIARAAEYYNQLLQKLNIAGKYEEIKVNDKVRFTYLLPTNKYAINCIAYHDGRWPEEFSEIFNIDYSLMFDKCVLAPLRKFLIALNYSSIKPGQELAYDILDI